MHSIILTTINARYIHASLGLRYLLANMGDLRANTELLEFTLEHRPEDIVESLLSPELKIIGFGTYIWNVSETTQVIRLLKILRPDITIVVGGPEVSFETGEQDIARLADYVITGQADFAFGELCQKLLNGEKPARLISPLPFDLNALKPPYPCYSDADLAHRVLYVEASRGCPFKCEFCLSSLDKTATAFNLEHFLDQMQLLVARGARQFKFVDRTFNLKADTCRRILEFFLSHIDKGLFLHFELIPDRLPELLRDLLPAFPAGSLQFEIGIQTFNTDVQKLISRKQQHDKTCENIRWLRSCTHAYIHADLIFGLPGENLASFADGFDLLYSLQPQEIQVGILKRLRGTPITRHSELYGMRYMSTPPYRILANRDVEFDTMQRMVRFARYWDLIGNSGRFPASLPLLLGDAPFQRFMALSDWLFKSTGQTHKISLPRLFEVLWRGMVEVFELDTDIVAGELHRDYRHNRLKGKPTFSANTSNTVSTTRRENSSVRHRAQRQQRHNVL